MRQSLDRGSKYQTTSHLLLECLMQCGWSMTVMAELDTCLLACFGDGVSVAGISGVVAEDHGVFDGPVPLSSAW